MKAPVGKTSPPCSGSSQRVRVSRGGRDCTATSRLPTPNSESERRYWNERFEPDEYIFGEEPADFLLQVAELLPVRGRAIDLAGGEGRNAVFLAERGLDVTVLDLSSVGLEKARALARARGVTLSTREVDLETACLEPESADLLVCLYYTQRSLFGPMAAALKPGGLLVMENCTTDQPAHERVSRNSEFRLLPNELLHAFPGLRVVRYYEGQVPRGIPRGKHVAGIVARRD